MSRAAPPMAGLFHNLGRRLGHAAVPALRKSKWIWEGLVGNEEDALRAEAAFGAALAVEVRQATVPAADPERARGLGEVCRRLAACVRDQRRSFRVEVMQDETPNAMALPGGFMFVSHSLIAFCEARPDELAFVLGHEMAHVIRGHTWDRMLNQTAANVASVITARVGPLGHWLRHKGLALLQRAHEREAETEADELGFRLAHAARYRAEGALALLQRLAVLEQQGTSLGAYFASHPPASERLARLNGLRRGKSV